MRQEIPEYDFRLSYTADVWNVGDRIASPVNDDSGNQFRFQGAAEVVMTTYSCEAGKEAKRFFYVRVYPVLNNPMNIITIKDTSGAMRDIDADEMVSEIIKNPTPSSCIFGMTLATMLLLRQEYLVRGGNLPMTPESVKETFNQSK